MKAILACETLEELPGCYSELGAVRTVDGTTRIVEDSGLVGDVLDEIAKRCDDGAAPSGKDLETHFAGSPYAWSLEHVRLGIATLLRNSRVRHCLLRVR